VAHFILGVLEKFGQGVVPMVAEVNGEPAVIGIRDGELMAMWTVDVTSEGVSRLFIVLNPQKLSRLAGDVLSQIR
jgi:RNA polymerase sigma-70 factor (ECF subfamily)